MNRPAVCVVKVGGSLLDYELLPNELHRSLDADRQKHDARHYVLVAGGGKWADTIRQVDREAPIGDETAHWLCVQAMSTTAKLLAGQVTDARLITDLGNLCERLTRPGQTVFDCQSFLREDEPRAPGIRLPESWDVTSDSIAARLAIVLGAEELVLLKSTAPPANSWRDLAAADYVDRFFEQLTAELPATRIVNLRDPGFETSAFETSC